MSNEPTEGEFLEGNYRGAQEDAESICIECGNDLVVEGYEFCSECLEVLDRIAEKVLLPPPPRMLPPRMATFRIDPFKIDPELTKKMTDTMHKVRMELNLQTEKVAKTLIELNVALVDVECFWRETGERTAMRSEYDRRRRARRRRR